jgi:hypothetical protein
MQEDFQWYSHRNSSFTTSFLELCCKQERREAFMVGDSPWYRVSLKLPVMELDLKNCTTKHKWMGHF